ncbi:MAG: hypothetical protein AB7F22_30195 [Reyranella sp.]|uniref:hypothetical protein n=1 Tax=Reyranella sp. TaxID=1929291 RepID=UPI003D12A244
MYQRINRNSLSQFMRRQKVVVWPAKNGTSRKIAKDETRFLYATGKKWRAAEKRIRREVRRAAGEVL